MGIQNLHAHFIVPFIQSQWGSISWIQTLYLSTSPYNMPELVGSAAAVVITYIVKFFLDKFIVFRKGFGSFRETNIQFWIYFLFAIITTAENLGIQFLLGILTPLGLNLRIGIALTLGYITKFLLDRKYCFKVDQPSRNSSLVKNENKQKKNGRESRKKKLD